MLDRPRARRRLARRAACLTAAAAILLPGTGLAGMAATQDILPELVFDARAAEHLLNRAGFGASSEEVDAAVERGLVATVDLLLAGPDRPRDPFFAERVSYRNVDPVRRRAELEALAGRDLDELTDEERDDVAREWRRKAIRTDQAQLIAYTEWWLDGLLRGEDPLRDRLTLFWMGYFTSSQEDVKDSHEMILQHRLLRGQALGSFGELLRGIARDPAMLEYLDNDDNKAESPNENFARELLELFTLGEGHYTEADVIDAARAFTGWTDRRGEFRFRNSRHDRGKKRFLGREGKFDGDDILEILHEEPRTASYVCERLIEFLEGTEASPERAERYAQILRENDLELRPVVRALLLDPDFYRDEVVGNRIAGPVDLLVGATQRVGVDPPSRLVAAGCRVLGQRIFYPPNVKGWEGNEGWITTSSFMQRGNLAGVLLGVVAVGELLDEPADEYEAAMGSSTMDGDMSGDEDGASRGPRGARLRDRVMDRIGERFDNLPQNPALRDLTRTESIGWTPRYYLAARLDRVGAADDEAVVDWLLDELLATRVGPATRAEVLGLFSGQREELSLQEGPWVEAGPDVEHLLRRTAHVILSLPEAQLH
ncbi:DUF1800 domain-containing protein [Engelhardtia mirabilis]|uniref:DUF1800 domain-containing protein n=1 Tax=Engelhardtia mirabilis TaxID=2528011 RepID=A0A518BSF9_9BACT|nr:hypothetical protein Pla133_50320 [Planctomycetes bacterium Pla133]QDV04235.1 hypothetical protein Pla86_50300 [Planctomycetes bacterium Pla86]